MLALRWKNLLRSRHLQKKQGLTVVDGLRCCHEAILQMPRQIEAIFCTETFLRSPHFQALGKLPCQPEVISESDMAACTETETPQGILLILRIPQPELCTKAPLPFILILDHLADPGNMGTILRTAWAVGMNSVWLVKGSADAWSPKAIRAGMGAQFSVVPYLFEDLPAAVSHAKKLGASHIWCTMPGKGLSLFDPAFHLRGSALIIGNEANGITRPEVGEPVTIPMPGHAESLNAAQAATAFLIESLRE